MSSARPRLRKFVLLAHVVSSVGWLGSVLAFLAVVLAALNSSDDTLVGGAYVLAYLLVWSVIVPLALASLVSGVLSSLLSPWGLVRHYWVITKLGLTVAATVVLLLQLEPIGAAAQVSTSLHAEPPSSAAGLSMLVHAVGGTVVLLVTAGLAIYKPRGTTRFGYRPKRTADEDEQAHAVRPR
jgi:hypothetical protein